MNATIAAVLEDALGRADAGWALGVMGALAEFLRDAGEPCRGTALERVTARGGLRIMPDHAEARLIAWEEPASTPGLWRQAAALCLPEAAAAIGGGAVLRARGPDAEALRPEDRAAELFELGVGFAHLQAMVRTDDPALIATLRAAEGQPFAAVGGAILAGSPHRVFVTRLARVEVYAPIPLPHGESPAGPHTHLLPKLLASGRAHAATRPTPEGWVSCLDLYPANPCFDAMGKRHGFDAAAHARFQVLLSRFGLPMLAAEKARVAVAARAAAAYAPPADRHGRAAMRVALRQLAATTPDLPGLAALRAVHDRVD